MKEQILYKELAKYYDLVYSDKDYKKETQKINQIVNKYKKSKGKELLEAACGTGEYLKYLKNYYNCQGFDLKAAMLKVCKNKVKGVKVFQADMINFKVSKKYDVIICMFSSIAYLKTYNNLEKAIKNFEKYLKPGGIIIIEPFVRKKDYNKGSVFINKYEDKDIKIIRMTYSDFEKGFAQFKMDYLIGKKNEGIKYFSEKHILGLYEPDRVLKIFKKNKLKASFIKDGIIKHRGLYIAVKYK